MKHCGINQINLYQPLLTSESMTKPAVQEYNESANNNTQLFSFHLADHPPH